MSMAMLFETPCRLVLKAETAGDLMTANPVSVTEDATLREALALLLDRGSSAAPVIDEAGRPVGVLSRSDLLTHHCETVEHLREAQEFCDKKELITSGGEPLGRGFQVEQVDRTRVRDMMTPAVFSVATDAPAAAVVKDLVRLNVHRLFVVDSQGVLIGVISATDLLRCLGPAK